MTEPCPDHTEPLIGVSVLLDFTSSNIVGMLTRSTCWLREHKAGRRDTQMVQSGDFKQAFEAQGEEGRKEGKKEEGTGGNATLKYVKINHKSATTM